MMTASTKLSCSATIFILNIDNNKKKCFLIIMIPEGSCETEECVVMLNVQLCHNFTIY